MNFLYKFWAWMRRPNKSTFAQYAETILIYVPLAFIIRTWGFGLYQVPTGSMETTMLVGERFFADKFTVLFTPLKHGDIVAFNSPLFQYSSNIFKRTFERYVWGPENVTKRLIGLPGDHIRGVIEDGKPVIYRNGEKLSESYVNHYPLIATYAKNTIYMRSYDEAYSFENQPFYTMRATDVAFAQKLLARCGQEYRANPGTPTFDESQNVDEFDIHLNDHQVWLMGDNRKGSMDSRFWGPGDIREIHGKIIFRLWSLDSYESWFIIDLLKHPINFWKRVRWSRFFQSIR